MYFFFKFARYSYTINVISTRKLTNNENLHFNKSLLLYGQYSILDNTTIMYNNRLYTHAIQR